MPKRKASFYGVRVGNQPGVYDDWEVCKQQVLGFPGSKYKGFSTRAEAENFVNEVLISSEINSISKTENPRKHGLPVGRSKTIPYYSCCTTPTEEVTRSKKVISPPKKEVATPKKEAISSLHLSSDDLSKYFRTVEENGQKFIVFESIKDFDLYFESLCRLRCPNSTWNSETLLANVKELSGCRNVDASKPSRTQDVMEDEEFVYFKDEDELRSFLEPYFENPKEGPGEVSPRSDVVEEIVSLAYQGTFQLEFDGASKGNPGRAGAGALIRCPHGSVVLEMTEFLGHQTNNVAEYRSLIMGLKTALSKGIRRVRAQGDSKLVCLQVVGAWRVENQKLMALHEEVKKLKESFEVFSIAHVLREYNSAADALANEAVYLGDSREIVKPKPKCCV